MMSRKRILTDETGQEIVNVLEVIAQTNIARKDMDWPTVQAIVANGAGSKAFAIGTQLIEKWTDTADSKEYDMPWQVNHFEDVTLEDGEIVPGMWLQTHYTLPFDIQFSHQRAFFACPNGLEAGTYHFDFAQAWDNIKNSVNYQFTLAKPVEKGGRLKLSDKANEIHSSTWNVYSYGKDGTTINETVNVKQGSDGANLGTIQYNSRSGNLNSAQEIIHGYNRWKTSALRQYLNSNKPKGQWWIPQDAWDICPNKLASKDGFLCGMHEEMLNCLKKVKVSTFANLVTDRGVEDITYDYVTIPSFQQMHIVPEINGEGNTHQYWIRRSGRLQPCNRKDVYTNMIQYSIADKLTPKACVVRSAYRESVRGTWNIDSKGYINDNSTAISELGFTPLVCIA